MVFLSETRRSAQHALHLRWRIGLKNAIGVDSEGQGGGLVLFWHENLEVVLLGKSSRFIDVHVKVVELNLWARITFVYGEPRVENRHLMWETLRRLRSVSDLPWLVVGDFNETMCSYEHFSACPRLERQIELFCDALSDCELTDIGFTGLPFTYDNGRASEANVRVRLDRAVADTSWRDNFGDARVQHLTLPRSDHCPVIVELRKDIWENNDPRIFRYEIMWERADSLVAEIKTAWCSTSDRESLGSLTHVLRNVRTALRRWSKEQFGAVTAELNRLRKDLEEAKSISENNRRDIRAITDWMDKLLYREEMMWLQRSRISWLKGGD
jgi:hypothetical protein